MSEQRLWAYDRLVLWLEAIGCDSDGQVVLDAVTMGVGQGELLVVQGGVAAGKSTLLKVAAVRRSPDRGAVWFAGRNVSALQRASLPFVRRNIGYATPDSLLLPDETALANVMLALAVRGESIPDAESSAHDALALVGADGFAARRVRGLSSGQARQVSLARAIVGPPPLVVADEPAALADEDLRHKIVLALAAVSQRGSAVLCGTADVLLAEKLVGHGGRRINLAEGRIVGAPAVGLVPSLSGEAAGDQLAELRAQAGEEGEAEDLPAARGPA